MYQHVENRVLNRCDVSSLKWQVVFTANQNRCVIYNFYRYRIYDDAVAPDKDTVYYYYFFVENTSPLSHPPVLGFI